MKKYRDYIINLEEFKNVNLNKESGIVEIFIGKDSYITYGKSIAATIINVIKKLEKGVKINEMILDAYNKFGDSSIKVNILEVSSCNLKAKKNYYVKCKEPKLNYKNSLSGFTLKHKQNMSDKKKGEFHNGSKLSEREVIEIIKVSNTDNISSKQIAKMFNISSSQVRKIKSGHAWKHISRELI